MALFQMKWLRRFIRKNTRPVPFATAGMWKQRLSIGYAFLAWNAFGFVMYAIYTGRSDWAKELKTPEELAMSPAQSFARQFKMEKAKVIRLSGISVVNQFEIDNTAEKEE